MKFVSGLALARLLHEIAIWRRAWRRPLIWWRDDDARSPDWRLDRLLETRRRLPITLAIIPDGDLPALARRLDREPRLTIAQHGVDHVNRLAPGVARSEFPLHMKQEAINAAVSAGRARMAASGLNPLLFVPPWNEASYRLLGAMIAARFDVFSSGSHGRAEWGLGHVGASVDLLTWKSAPRFRGPRRIFDALREQLEDHRSRGAFEEPIGILTHHLAMDEPAWRFVERFVPWSDRFFTWRSFTEIWRSKQSPVIRSTTVRRPLGS